MAMTQSKRKIDQTPMMLDAERVELPAEHRPTATDSRNDRSLEVERPAQNQPPVKPAYDPRRTLRTLGRQASMAEHLFDIYDRYTTVGLHLAAVSAEQRIPYGTAVGLAVKRCMDSKSIDLDPKALIQEVMSVSKCAQELRDGTTLRGDDLVKEAVLKHVTRERKVRKEQLRLRVAAPCCLPQQAGGSRKDSTLIGHS